jgi:enamine deaminase RidA (YjgF/YER057c/UK114 family)
VRIEIIKSAAPRPLANYSECFKFGPWVFAASQIASDYKTGVAPEARRKPAFPYYGSDIKLQTHYILGNLKKTFEAAGSSLDHVVKAQVFMTDLDNFTAFDEVWREYFKVPPARTTVGTSGLLVPGTLVEIDLIGYAPDQGIEHKAIKSAAPTPLANYTEGFAVGNMIFAAGQIASDYKTGAPPRRKGIRPSPITARTSRSRPAISSTISRARSRRRAAPSMRWSRRRSS